MDYKNGTTFCSQCAPGTFSKWVWILISITLMVLCKSGVSNVLNGWTAALHWGIILLYLVTPCFNEVEREVYWLLHTGFTLSICGQKRVRSVSSTILVGSISYLHILSSNLRRCVACNVCFKIKKIKILVFKFVILTLSSFDLGPNMTQYYG